MKTKLVLSRYADYQSVFARSHSGKIEPSDPIRGWGKPFLFTFAAIALFAAAFFWVV